MLKQEGQQQIGRLVEKSDDSWIENVVLEAHKCLNGDKIPESGDNCDYCEYIEAVNGECIKNA